MGLYHFFLQFIVIIYRMKLLLMTCWGEEKDWRRCHNLTPEGLLMTSVPGTIPSGRATKAWTFPVIDMTAISYSWATLLGTQGSNSWCTYGHSRSSINCKSHPVCGWSWIYWWLDKNSGKIDGNVIYSHQKVHSPAPVQRSSTEWVTND